MYYLGIDIAKKKHHTVLLDSEGEKVGKSFSFDNSQEGTNSLLQYIKERGITKNEVLIGMEATGNFWENLYSFLTDREFKVIVLNPHQTNKFREAIRKKAKTDDIDALVTAGLLRSNEYSASYIPKESIENIRELVKLRYGFKKDHKNYKREAMSLLNLVFPEYSKTAIKNPFTIAATAILTEYPTAKHLAAAKPKKIEKIVRSIKGNNFNIKEIETLIATAKASIYSGRSAEVRAMKLRMLLSHIESLNKSIETINKHIEDILSPSSDKGSFPGQNLFTIPGIGPKTIATMLSLVGDTGATFENGTKLVGHIGFFPQIFESGETKYANKISKKGPKYARWGLYMGAVACIRHNKEMQYLYYNKLSQGKTEKQALVCVAKKITHMMLSMLKSGENYRPERVFMIC